MDSRIPSSRPKRTESVVFRGSRKPSVARTQSQRNVYTVPATSRFNRHPLVLKIELRQRLGDRVISRLRDLAKQHKINIHPVSTSSIEDNELCEQAKLLSKKFTEPGYDLASDDELTDTITALLEREGVPLQNKQALEKLLHLVASDEFAPESEGDISVQYLEPMIGQFKPRTISVFLQTDFGNYVLDKLQQGEYLTDPEASKMLLGLTHIKSRLDVRPSSLSDIPLVEYANLYMGEDLDLDTVDVIEATVLSTLDKILDQRQKDYIQESHLLRELEKATQTSLTVKRLPLTIKELKSLRETDPLSRLYRKLMGHPELREYLHDDELSMDDLHNSLKYLQTSKIETRMDIKALADEVEACSIHSEKDTETKHLQRLSKTLGRSGKHCGNSLERQAIKLLKDHVDYQILQEVRRNFEEELYKQLSFLEKGGSEKTFTASVNVGAAFSAAGVSGVGLGGKLEYTFKVTGNDDVRVRQFHYVKPTLSLSLGDSKIAQATAEVGADYGKGKVFRNLKEFVDYHSNDFLPMLLGSMGNLPRNAVGTINVRRAQNLHKSVTADRHLLSHRLTQLGVLLPGDQVRVQQTRPVNYADFQQHAVRGQVTLSALAGLMEGKVAVRNSATHFKTRTNLLLMLRNNPDKAKPKHKSYISFWAPATIQEKQLYAQLKESVEGDWTGTSSSLLSLFKEEDGLVSRRISNRDAIDWLGGTQRELDDIKDDIEKSSLSKAELEDLNKRRFAIRDKLKKAIVDQFLERDMYYYTVNAMEGHVGEEAPQEHFHSAKHSMQDTYNAKDRGEFIAAHIYSYYNLHRLYEQTFLQGESPVINDAVFQQVLEQHIEPSLNTPQIHLDNEKHVRKSMTASSVARSTEQSAEGEITLSVPGTSLSTSANFKFTQIGKNTNPDNDGKYFNISLNINAGSSPALVIKALDTAIAQMRVKDSNFPDVTVAECIPEVLGASASIEAGIKLDFNFVKREKGWRLQYTRLCGSDGIGISSPDIGIPTGPIGEVSIGFSGKVSSVHNWWEQPGNNTLTYMYAKYNGWRAAQMIHTPSWEETKEVKAGPELRAENPFHHYVLKHKKEISKMLANMGNPEKSAHRELVEMLEKLNPYDPLNDDERFGSEFLADLKAYSEKPNPDEMEPLIKKFEKFLSMQHDVYLKEARSRYQPHYRKGRII